MRNRAILRLLAALSVLVLLAAACGDDDTSVSTDITDGASGPDDAADMDDMDDTDADTHDDDSHDMDDMDGDTHDDDSHDMDDMDGDTHDDDSHDMGDMDDDSHDHATLYEVAAEGAPTVDIEVFDDPAGGVNIHVLTENFVVNAEAASTAAVEGEGHFHLFVDGKRALRFYNEWIHYSGVVEGDVEISVGLATNDHQAYAISNEEIRADVVFAVPAHAHDAHAHDELTEVEFVGDAPTLGIEVIADPKSGWNAFVTIDGITMSPEHASGDHVDGEGHLHIFANGQKLGRLYGSATHMSVLPEGDVEISVVAYTNDHNPYVVDGQPVSAATTVAVPS